MSITARLLRAYMLDIASSNPCMNQAASLRKIQYLSALIIAGTY
jgi:hypothetical protein